MDLKTYWSTYPGIEGKYPKQWKTLRSAIERDKSNYITHVGDEDRRNKVIASVRDNDGNSIGDLRYTQAEFARLSSEEALNDLSIITSIPSYRHKQLLQSVFDHFIEESEWPNSREMSIKVKDLGNYYKLAREVGYDYIKTGEEHVAGATTRLAVKGISLCENAENDLLVFLQVLRIFTEKYNNNPIRPTVDMLELNKSNILTLSQMDRVSLLIAEEGHLFTGAGSSQGKNFTFTVAPSILEFEKVETIRDYLRVQESFRGSDEPITLPYETIELTEGGIVATRRINEIEFEYDLFISYSSMDRTEALKIREKAQMFSLKCFLDKKDIKKGKYWDPEIRNALKKSREIAVLATPNSITSEWIYAEAGAAWVLDKDLTPIILRCDFKQLHPLLQQREGIDYHEIDDFLKELSESKNVS